MLRLIGSIIVAFLSIVSGSGMNRYIISSLFMTDDEEIPNSKTNNEQSFEFRTMQSRSPLKTKIYQCLSN